MKVPYNLQRMLTRNQNRFLRKNVTGERWSADPFSVTNSNGSYQAFLQKKAGRLRYLSEEKRFEVLTLRKGRRVTKRKGKRSSQKAPRVWVESRPSSAKNSFGKKSCPYLIQKAKRLVRAVKRAERIEAVNA